MKVELTEEQVATIKQMLNFNELQIASIGKLANTVLTGYKTIDIIVRKDGQEYHFEADWLAVMLRLCLKIKKEEENNEHK